MGDGRPPPPPLQLPAPSALEGLAAPVGASGKGWPSRLRIEPMWSAGGRPGPEPPWTMCGQSVCHSRKPERSAF
jgi:hypothetical protein